MRVFWKILMVALAVAYGACFLIDLSMYWWPDMPTLPNPAQGRVYALNNHGYYTYMNAWEQRLHNTIFFLMLPLLFAGIGLIMHFVDPFDVKRKRRYGSPPPGFR
jgi:hypothetical protein